MKINKSLICFKELLKIIKKIILGMGQILIRIIFKINKILDKGNKIRNHHRI